jgi:hypothetical protein
MRRLIALTVVLASAPLVVLGTAGSAAADPLPIVGDGAKKRVCLVWYGNDAQGAGSPESTSNGDYCVTY